MSNNELESTPVADGAPPWRDDVHGLSVADQTRESSMIRL